MLTLKDTQSLVNEIDILLVKEGAAQEIPVGSYAKMQYPKWLPCFRFLVSQYFLKEIGNVMIMQTKGFGEMHLMTMTVTPNIGTNLPFLLIDSMSIGKKRAVFVEYYDCTVKKQIPETLSNVAKQYQHLPDYEEKPAWYAPLRTSYSLIKGNTNKEEPELIGMILSEVRAYLELSHQKKERDAENITELKAFRERMIKEGNPSSKILSKVLGEEGAKEFYRTYIMPIE